MSYSYVDDYLRTLPVEISSTLFCGGGAAGSTSSGAASHHHPSYSDQNIDDLIAGLLRPYATAPGATATSSHHPLPSEHSVSSPLPTSSIHSKFDTDSYYRSLLDVDGYIASLSRGGEKDAAPFSPTFVKPHPDAPVDGTRSFLSSTTPSTTTRAGLSTSRSTDDTRRHPTSSSATTTSNGKEETSGSPRVTFQDDEATDLRVAHPQPRSAGGTFSPSVSNRVARSVRFEDSPPAKPTTTTTTTPTVAGDDSRTRASLDEGARWLPDDNTPTMGDAMETTLRPPMGFLTESPTSPSTRTADATPQRKCSSVNAASWTPTRGGPTPDDGNPISPQPFAEEITRDEEVYHSSRRAKRSATVRRGTLEPPSPTPQRSLREAPLFTSPPRRDVRSTLFPDQDEEEGVGGAQGKGKGRGVDWGDMFTPERYNYLNRRQWSARPDDGVARVPAAATLYGDDNETDAEVSALVNALDAALSRSLARQEAVSKRERDQMNAFTQFTDGALRAIACRLDPTRCWLLEGDGESSGGGGDSDGSESTSSDSPSEDEEESSSVDGTHTPAKAVSGDVEDEVAPSNQRDGGWWDLTERITRRLLEAPTELSGGDDVASVAAVESARVAFRDVLHTLVRKPEFLLAATPRRTPSRGTPAVTSPWMAGGNADTPTDRALSRLRRAERVGEVQSTLAMIATALAPPPTHGGDPTPATPTQLHTQSNSRLDFLRRQQASLQEIVRSKRASIARALEERAGDARHHYDEMRTFLVTNDLQLADLVSQKEAIEGRIEIALHSRRCQMVEFVEYLSKIAGATHHPEEIPPQVPSNAMKELQRSLRHITNECQREQAHATLMSTLQQQVLLPLSTLHFATGATSTTTQDSSPDAGDGGCTPLGTRPDDVGGILLGGSHTDATPLHFLDFYEPDAADGGRDGSPPEVDWNVVLEEGAAYDNHPSENRPPPPTTLDSVPERFTSRVSMGALFNLEHDESD